MLVSLDFLSLFPLNFHFLQGPRRRHHRAIPSSLREVLRLTLRSPVHVADEGGLVPRQDVGDRVAVEVLVAKLLSHQSKVFSQLIFFADLKKQQRKVSEGKKKREVDKTLKNLASYEIG